MLVLRKRYYEKVGASLWLQYASAQPELSPTYNARPVVKLSCFSKIGRKECVNKKRLRLTKHRCSVIEKMKRIRASKQRTRTVDAPCEFTTNEEVELNMSVPSVESTCNENEKMLHSEGEIFSSEDEDCYFSNSDHTKEIGFSTESLSDLEIELIEQKNKNSSPKLVAAKIVNIAHFFSALKSLKHDEFGCSFFDIDIVSERHKGFMRDNFNGKFRKFVDEHR
ncbi:hypothetical protein FQA39_LY09660 [Lamprigera yunnana]|nr:hypothetical protein FQA39_LY09660 [Lamprigera yunnana]